jgi:hypothetical protein
MNCSEFSRLYLWNQYVCWWFNLLKINESGKLWKVGWSRTINARVIDLHVEFENHNLGFKKKKTSSCESIRISIQLARRRSCSCINQSEYLLKKQMLPRAPQPYDATWSCAVLNIRAKHVTGTVCPQVHRSGLARMQFGYSVVLPPVW